MSKFFASVACLLLATPALAQSMGETTGANAVLGVAPSTADFVKEAAISDMFEIQSSQLAQQKNDTGAKAFSETMIHDHTQTTDQLKSLVKSGAVQAQLPTMLDDTHQKMLDTLHGLSGAAFAKQYDQDQVDGHKEAVSLFQRYAKGGDNAKLKDWAAKTLPTLQHHLQMAQNLSVNS